MALTAAQRAMVEAHQGLAYSAVRRSGLTGDLAAEALGEALLALSEAALTYDPSRASYSTYAFTRCRGAVLDYLERNGKSRTFYESGGRSTQPNRTPVTYDRGFTAVPRSVPSWQALERVDGSPSPEDTLLDKEAQEALLSALESAPSPVRIVGRLTADGLSVEAIARITNMSETTVLRRRRDMRSHVRAITSAKDND